MKCDQIAYYCSTPEAEEKVKRLLGLKDAIWIKDEVTAFSNVRGRNVDTLNVAELQFNYDLGIELEIIRYVKGDHWHNPFFGPEPFISHVGIHLEDGEPFPEMADCELVQETFTQKHTSEYLTTGAGAGRKYHYRIFQIAPQTYIKYIRRIHPK